MALIPFLVIKTLLLGNIFTFFQGTALCRQNQHTDLVNLLVSQAKSTTTSESVQSRDHFWFCTASACHALTVRVTVGSLCTTYLYLRICWSRLCFTAIIITRTPLLVHINKLPTVFIPEPSVLSYLDRENRTRQLLHADWDSVNQPDLCRSHHTARAEFVFISDTSGQNAVQNAHRSPVAYRDM